MDPTVALILLGLAGGIYAGEGIYHGAKKLVTGTPHVVNTVRKDIRHGTRQAAIKTGHGVVHVVTLGHK